MSTPAQRSPTSARRPLPPPDDTGHGLVILTLTVGGSLVVTAAVGGIALDPTVWVAGFAFAILVALAGVIVAAVLRAVSSGPVLPAVRAGRRGNPERSIGSGEPQRRSAPTTEPAAASR